MKNVNTSSVKKCVVIGSNCFSGSHLVDDLLTNGNYQVIGLSRSREKKDFYLPYKSNANAASLFRFQQLDLNKNAGGLISFLKKERPQIVINFAALSEVDLSNLEPVEYFDTNCRAVVQLCNYLRTVEYLEKYIHISSAEIYGACDQYVTESAPLRPSTPYAVSKAAADLYLLTLWKNFSFPVTLIRSTNVYGKHQQLYKIIPRSIIYLKKRKLIELHGGGNSIKSFIHIRDVARGILKVLRQDTPKPIYHFSTNNNLTIRQIVEMICKKMGRPFESSATISEERMGQDPRYLLDSTLSRKELGWQPVENFEKGVEETIDWVESLWQKVLGEPLTYQHKI
jgi:dTDP-glucose 4,6-dehydratase